MKQQLNALAALAIVALTPACGTVRSRTSTHVVVKNDSSHALKVTTKLSSSSVEDNCGTSSDQTKTIDVAPKSREESSVSMNCGYPPSGSTSAVAYFADAAAEPTVWTYNANIDLLEPGSLVDSFRVLMGDETKARAFSLTDGPVIESNGLPEGTKTSDAFQTSFDPYKTDAVRLRRYDRQANALLFFSSEKRQSIRAIGVPTELVPDLVKHPADEWTRVRGYELDGYWYVPTFETGYGVSFVFGKTGYEALITCNDQGCDTK